WAMAHRGLGLFGLVAILVFSFLVFESFVYLISNGALNWGPAKVVRRLEAAIDGGRTTTSTVHRVGLEGREPTTREAA
ncbi:MAG: NADH-quinone oxidoreductase subunit A, partial [Acidimicrobiia bacterium]|nr:NADH-quinone oxidoreductase subunit A [Acidimicrobiia bacterium]